MAKNKPSIVRGMRIAVGSDFIATDKATSKNLALKVVYKSGPYVTFSLPNGEEVIGSKLDVSKKDHETVYIGKTLYSLMAIGGGTKPGTVKVEEKHLAAILALGDAKTKRFLGTVTDKNGIRWEFSLKHAKATKNRQLAPGVSKGSRHIVSEGPTLFEAPNAGSWRGVLNGPLVVSKERFKLTHPEHAHFELPAGSYAVFYQADVQRDVIRRALD